MKGEAGTDSVLGAEQKAGEWAEQGGGVGYWGGYSAQYSLAAPAVGGEVAGEGEESGEGGAGGGAELGQHYRETTAGPIRGYNARADPFVWRPY